MKTPKISVIMPLYNAEPFVKKTIECILNQTYRDFELLLIDDCSTDGTMEIVESIKDDRIRILHNGKNHGIAYSRNAGLAYAVGEYIALMDDDDLTPPDRFAKEAAYLDNHPGIGVVGGSSVWIDEDDHEITPRAKMIANPDILWADILFQCPVANSSTMFRRSIITENNIRYRDHMLGMEDYCFWTEVSHVAAIYNFDEVFLKWRSAGSSETARVKESQKSQRSKKFAEIQKRALQARGYSLTPSEIKLFTTVFSEYKDAECKDLSKVLKLMRKLQQQTCELYADKAEATRLVLRNRFLEAARREGVPFKKALGKTGFGNICPPAEEPMVSVIIPTHNRAELIESSVKSVLAQTYDNLEIIIVDDQSQDRTEKVCRKLCAKHPRVSYYKPERNLGPAGARNFGVTKAQGTYVAFHDDDDEWHADKLEIQMKTMLDDPSIDMTFGQMVRYEEEKLLNIVDKDFEWDRIKERYLQEILLDNYVGAPTIVIKKEKFEEIGGFCEEIKSIEDWEFAIRTAINCKVEFIAVPLMDVHVQTASVTHNVNNYLQSWLYIYRKYHHLATDQSEYVLHMIRHFNGNCIIPSEEDAKKMELVRTVKTELVPDYISDPMAIDVLIKEYRDAATLASNGDSSGLIQYIRKLENGLEAYKEGVEWRDSVIEKQKANNEELDEQIHSLQDYVHRLEEGLEAGKDALEWRDSVIEEQKANNEDLTEQLHSLQDYVHRLEEGLEGDKEALAWRDSIIEQQKANNEELTEQVHRFADYIHTLEAGIEWWKAKAEKKESPTKSKS